MARKEKGNNHPTKEYTNEDLGHDMRLIAEAIKKLTGRMEAVENMAKEGSDEDFDQGDRRKSLSILVDNVINPSGIMLPQMTETPNRMAIPLINEHTLNEYIGIVNKDPGSDVLLSDIWMKWYAIVMRSLRRQLIQEAMGFSQIEMEKQVEEDERKMVLED